RAMTQGTTRTCRYELFVVVLFCQRQAFGEMRRGTIGRLVKVGVCGGSTAIVNFVQTQDSNPQPQHGAVLLAPREPPDVRVEHVERIGALPELGVGDDSD